MARNKTLKLKEFKEFPNTFENPTEIKGNWGKIFFKNNNPIVLELGCGKGEYTLGLAKMFPDKNFIGVDVKGARLWKGAKTAIENEINNVAFLRIYIDHITDYFAKDEVSEIWLTFPDPQPKKGHIKKRLTNKKFIDLYSQILSKSGSLHLKTDSELMFEYTNEVIAENKINCIRQTSDLYNSDLVDKILSVKTTYEQKFLEIGSTIKYIEFTL
ncbi:MAG: tRNA (guanosine(46)-N7)-methyltransferase TrmB [Bacteroidia bacterium]|nr:tRNA (guanosine(46)-N7)-methyltransferase TrmB [Bacteroidia bacterium]